MIKDEVAKTSKILVEPHLIDAEFRKAWMPFFCRSGQVVTVDQFLAFVDPFFTQETVIDLPRTTGQDLLDVAGAKRSTAGGLDGWAWNEVKALPFPWFSGLAILLNMMELSGCWLQGLLDAYIAMIPKADGDATSLGQRLISVLPVVYRLWASLRPHLQEWVQGWVPQSVSSVEAWFSTALDIEEVLAGAGSDQPHVLVADVIKSFDTVDRSILDCSLGRLGLPAWFKKVYFPYHYHVRLRFKLAAGFGEPWCRDGRYSSGMPPPAWCSSLPCMSLGVGDWRLRLVLSPGYTRIILSAVLKAPGPSLVRLDLLYSMSGRSGRSSQDVSPGECVLLSTSKAVRKSMKLWDVSVAILAQEPFPVRTCTVFFRSRAFWFCLVQVSTTPFCCFLPLPMARVSDGTNVPISPAQASSSNLGSLNGSLPDLEGVGGHPT